MQDEESSGDCLDNKVNVLNSTELYVPLKMGKMENCIVCIFYNLKQQRALNSPGQLVGRHPLHRKIAGLVLCHGTYPGYWFDPRQLIDDIIKV